MLMRCLFLLVVLLSGTTEARASIGGWLYDSNRQFEAWLASLDEREIVIDGIRWHYYERKSAQQDCLVMIHGFTAEASNWFRFARHLDRERCLIIPDLPGFGKSEYKPTVSYTIPAQQERLAKFLQTVRPGARFDLAGSSMGGHIVLRYALQSPSLVKSLVIIDGGGVRSPTKSEATREFDKTGQSAFELQSRDDFAPFLKVTMAQVPWMPVVVQDHLADEFIDRRDRYQSIFRQIYFRDLLDDRLHELGMPALVIWGEKDRLLHPSMAYRLRALMPGARVSMMPGIGHLPFLEAPSATAEKVEAFLKSLE